MARNRKPKEDNAEISPPAAPPPIITTSERRFSGIPSIVAYLALALIVVLAVVFGGRWIYDQTRREPTKKPAPTTTQPTPPPATTKPKPSGGTSNGQRPSEQGATTPSTGSQEGEELANTGPGDTAAIFIGTSIAVAALHYIYQLRRSDYKLNR